MNIPSTLDNTVKIFDSFYDSTISVNANEYEIVYSFFRQNTESEEVAKSFTENLFRISNLTDKNALELLQSFESGNSMKITLTMAYYLNSVSNKTVLYGVSNVLSPNESSQRNILNDNPVAPIIIVPVPPPPPEADFSGYPTTGDQPLTVNFTDLSTNSPTSWAWDFDNDGVVDSTDQNPTHTYLEQGTYTVKLTVSNAYGTNSITKIDYITVTGLAPTADFSGLPLTGQYPLTVNFTDLSTNSPTSWAWDFTNNGIVDSTVQNPGYTYNAPGTYTVKLTSSNEFGSDSEIKTSYVTVTSPPPIPLSISWTTTQNNVLPEIPGGWVIEDDGRTITFIIQDSENCGGPNDQTQTGEATATITTGATGYAMTYLLTGIGEVEDNNYESMDLYFNDELVSFSLSPGGGRGCDPCEPVNQFVTIPGPYILPANTTSTFKLEFSTRDPLYHLDSFFTCVLTFTETATLPGPPNTFISIPITEYCTPDATNITDNIAWYTFQITILANVTISTTTTSSTPKIGLYNLSGNKISTATHPSSISINNLAVGYYFIALAVGNVTFGDTNFQVISDTVYPTECDIKLSTTAVEQVPIALLKAQPVSGPAPLLVYFDSISERADTYSWDCNNDGTVDGTSDYIQYNYTQEGVYTAKLTVSNSYGSDTNFLTINVTPPWAAVDFTATNSVGFAPLTVDFIDQTANNPISWQWDFTNDGTVDSTVQNPSHTYTTPGNYSVKLFSSNLYGGNSFVKNNFVSVLEVLPPPTPDMRLVFDTTKTSATNTVELPFYNATTVNVTVDWGDGVVETITTPGSKLHTYSTAGIYTVSITGTLSRFGLPNLNVSWVGSNYYSLVSVPSFGDIGLTDLSFAFAFTQNLLSVSTVLPTTVTNLKGLLSNSRSLLYYIAYWDTTNVTDMSYAFYRDYEFNPPVTNWNVSNVTNMSYMFYDTTFSRDISNWNVSNVTDMSYMFMYCTYFNSELNNWDVSSVTNMTSMFYEAQLFNSPINNWNVSNVTDMSWMFTGASNFDQSLNNWDVSNVTNMYGMFLYTDKFNQSLSEWDVSSVTNMSYMFRSASTFNQPLNNWNVSSVTNMSYMFNGADQFNQSLNNWDVSSVTNMEHMFDGAGEFNSDISNWNTSSVTNMSYMFIETLKFNQPLNIWNVTNVTNMTYMFAYTEAFNQSLNNWNVTNVTNMSNMFYAANLFNQPLDNWNVDSVTNMRYMFGSALAFNQPIGSWDVKNVTNMQYMFNDATSFNQNLTTWCVRYIYSEPSGFATNSALITANKPIWGTCPTLVTANFTAAPVDGTATLTVNFTDTSTGLPTTWQWDFTNDGTVDSTVQNPSHTYEVPGTYTVKLTASNNAFSDSEIKTNYIQVYPDGARIFNYTGAVELFTVPSDVTTIVVKLWGGAGGGNSEIGVGGGGGGYATCNLTVTPNEVLSVYVGGGGTGSSSTRIGGNGGGSSAIVRSGIPLIIAAGGGGAQYNSSGAGGGLSGENASVGGVTDVAQGGSQIAGGAGQTGGRNPGNTATDGNGADGYQVNGFITVNPTYGWTTGGRGGIYYGDGGGGGGGGGYWGGGGGGVNSFGGGTAGAGGSSYVPSGGSTLGGTGSTPGNSSDPDRGTAGAGSTSSGNPGIVIISWA